MTAKERPRVEILYAVQPSDKMLCGALAKANRKQSLRIEFARFRTTSEQLLQVLESLVGEHVKMLVSQVLERALTDDIRQSLHRISCALAAQPRRRIPEVGQGERLGRAARSKQERLTLRVAPEPHNVASGSAEDD
ncbi:MAG: hypothetical protein CMM50_16180 [Rhodospirillaceae bacterium]|nr:hypothetical protein [Rhodospirillaceae bacterium]